MRRLSAKQKELMWRIACKSESKAMRDIAARAVQAYYAEHPKAAEIDDYGNPVRLR